VIDQCIIDRKLRDLYNFQDLAPDNPNHRADSAGGDLGLPVNCFVFPFCFKFVELCRVFACELSIGLDHRDRLVSLEDLGRVIRGQEASGSLSLSCWEPV
jgi:hypothetical protein